MEEPDRFGLFYFRLYRLYRFFTEASRTKETVNFCSFQTKNPHVGQIIGRFVDKQRQM